MKHTETSQDFTYRLAEAQGDDRFWNGDPVGKALSDENTREQVHIVVSSAI
jgi:hypothetical protein